MCDDPATLGDAQWMLCYLTTPKHLNLYYSILTVLALVLLAAPLILALGFLGATARRAAMLPVRLFGCAYTNIVRGVPDIVFFLFVPIAIDQALEYVRHRTLCPDATGDVYRGADFVVCDAAKLPLSSAEPWVHDLYAFVLALAAFSIVFGAFAANVIDGALRAVPRGQVETGAAFGMTPRQIFWRIHIPQMWLYALPGLSNLWLLLVKATPLLFLLGIEDVVYWARELGASKSSFYAYPHPDWRVYYFGGLMVFYLAFTSVSEWVFALLSRRVARGRGLAGEARA